MLSTNNEKTVQSKNAEAQQTPRFHMAAVKCASDIPPAGRRRLREKWPWLKDGEVPNENGNVFVGQETPRDKWNEQVSSLLIDIENKPLSQLQQ